MQQVRIIRTGRAASEKSRARIASASFRRAHSNRTHLSLNESSAGKNVFGSARSGSMEAKTQSTGRTRAVETVAVLTSNGSTQLSAEMVRLASTAEHKKLSCTPITSNHSGTIRSFDSMSQTASRFALNAIGICTLHKMKRRLIRWIPDQVMLRAIPSQARRETCLKV